MCVQDGDSCESLPNVCKCFEPFSNNHTSVVDEHWLGGPVEVAMPDAVQLANILILENKCITLDEICNILIANLGTVDKLIYHKV